MNVDQKSQETGGSRKTINSKPDVNMVRAAHGRWKWRCWAAGVKKPLPRRVNAQIHALQCVFEHDSVGEGVVARLRAVRGLVVKLTDWRCAVIFQKP